MVGIEGVSDMRNALHQVTETPCIADLQAAAATFFGDLGPWAYDTWASHNAAFFGNRLTPGPILWGLTPHGHLLGSYAHGRNAITLHTALINPRSDAWCILDLLGERYAADVLLHEMIHQDLYQAGENTKHNEEPWCNSILRITLLLGLPPIKAKPIRQKRVGGKVTWFTEPGHLTRREIASWPQKRRPNFFNGR